MKKIIILLLIAFNCKAQVVNWSVQLAGGDNSWHASNATKVPLLRQLVLNTTTGQYKIGDGSTQLQNLSYYSGSLSSYVPKTLTSNIDITGNYQLQIGTPANKLTQLHSHLDNYVNYDIGNNGCELSLSNSIGLFAVSPDASNYVYSQITTAGQTVSDASTNNRFVIRDDVASKGLAGYADYSSNYTNNSYVQKAWVNNNYISNTSYSSTLGSYVNYNRQALQDWDAQIAKLILGTASTQAKVIFIGDSWTKQALFSGELTKHLKQKYGDAGIGYMGANSNSGAGTYGVDGFSGNRTKTSGWAEIGQNSYVIGASISADSSSTVNDSLTFSGQMDKFTIHWMRKTSGGSFVYRIDGTSPTTVSTSGSRAIQFTSVTGLTQASHTISIKVASAGQGVLISGCEVGKSDNGVVLNNLGFSGSTSSEWVLQDSTNWVSAINQLSPNMAVICLGVNDCSQSIPVATYTTNISRIVNRIRAVKPLCSIVLFTPSDLGITPTYPLLSYLSDLKNYALSNGYAFIDNYTLLGSYANANSRGLYTNSTHINTTGGNVLAQNFLDFIYDGKYNYYSSGNNTLFGESALANALSSGTANIAVGYQALYSNKSGTTNLAIGYQALKTSTNSLANNALGYLALTANTTGSSNIANGYRALAANTTGQRNVGTGVDVLRSNTIGSYNVANGFQALVSNTTGSYNIATGYLSMFGNTTGEGNNAYGYNSLFNVTSGTYNSGLGYAVGQNLTTGNYNTLLGFQAGLNVGAGDANICIGKNSGLRGAYSNRVYITGTAYANETDQNNNSLIYGEHSSTTANQFIRFNAKIGVNVLGTSLTPAALIHLGAGSTAAGSAPLKFTSGTNMTTAETGAVEYNGTNLLFTRTGTTRESVMTANAVNSVSPTSPNRTITVVIDGVTYYISAKTTND